MTKLQSEISTLAIEQGNAVENGDHENANRFHDKLTLLYRDQIVFQERRLELEELLDNDNDSVRLWAATFLLKSNAPLALKVLKILSESDGIISLYAESTIDLWNKGMLELL